MSRFSGRVALVTGGGSGIGRVIARRLAAEGAAVAVADIDPATARDAAAGITGSGGTARAYPVDVTDPGAVAAAAAAAAAELGTVGLLVNNAAVASDTRFEEVSLPDWEREVGVALTGAFLCSRAVLPGMLASRRGAIVNIGSVNALASFGNEPYSAAKAGLASLTRSLAVRYGRGGVRVNLVVAGTIRTPAWDHRLDRDPGLLERVARWYPLGRTGLPDDVANAVLFLASDDAAWITGTELRVDGGLLAGNLPMMLDLHGQDWLPPAGGPEGC
ncbi:MAG: SDR family oxidoreductase [Actinobacteria bacterium]|nr:SDR family oxidoreductase [Actinomycetota bacterium]MBO0784587.1 SDR family oxidoreductase [Actinomycetota bacterium]